MTGMKKRIVQLLHLIKEKLADTHGAPSLPTPPTTERRERFTPATAARGQQVNPFGIGLWRGVGAAGDAFYQDPISLPSFLAFTSHRFPICAGSGVSGTLIWLLMSKPAAFNTVLTARIAPRLCEVS